MDVPQQKIDFYPFNSTRLSVLLNLSPPSFLDRNSAFRQLAYIKKYLKALRCKTIVIERHYVDRDYMEDHSIFYSKNLSRYENYCQRVHFFLIPESQLKKKLEKILETGFKQGEQEYRLACENLSKEYLGFSVIRPLQGCPVGRTVLASFSENAENGAKRRFDCTRTYKIHLAGIELSIKGLAFQQQDAGVSACATTALWTAFHRFSEIEDISPITPAQITNFASRYTLPFGRSMPSEGLSIDQMCQAVQAFGVSPYLFKAERFSSTRDRICSATASGFPPVLILNRAGTDDWHAVTVVGMKVDPKSEAPTSMQGIDNKTGKLKAFYVHDDRHGPYLRADVIEGKKELRLGIAFESSTNSHKEIWCLRHVLIPMHSKIRLAFGDLGVISLDLKDDVESFGAALQALDKKTKIQQTPKANVQYRILRAHNYVRKLLLSSVKIDFDQLKILTREVPFSRYLGIVEVSPSFSEPIHIIFDSTSTMQNISMLGILPFGNKELTISLSRFLSNRLGCKLISSGL